jgi:hypothetical protein
MSPRTLIATLVGFAALVAGPAAAEPGAAYPGAAVAGEFKALCGDKMDLRARRKLAADRGWSSISAAPDSPVVAHTDYRKKLGEVAPGKPVKSDEAYFERVVSGEKLSAIMFRARAGSAWIEGCDVLDLGEARQEAVAVLEAELGPRPVIRGVSPEIAIILWFAQDGGKQSFTELAFAPPGSAAAANLRFGGVKLRKDFVGGP